MSNLDSAVKKRDELLAFASKNFRFRGTRKVRNNAFMLHGAPASAAAATAIPAGRKPKPFSELVKLPEEDIYNEKNEYNEEGRLLARYFPEPATKIAAGKDIKTSALRRAFFAPLDIKGLKGWLDRQQAYFDGLSTKDKDIIKSYTVHGDKLVNGYTRRTLDDISDLIRAMAVDASVPLAHSFYDQFHILQRRFGKAVIGDKTRYLDEDGDLNMGQIGAFFVKHIDFFGKSKNIETLLEQYKQDLIRIIDGSPRLTSDLVVYRGIERESHLTEYEYKNPDFLSTTLDPFSALRFTQVFEDPTSETRAKFYCCVYEMTLHKSVPCMYMQFISSFANEFEVLIPPGMNIRLAKEVQVKVKPSRREVTREEMLEPYFNEHVLVVSAEVRRPSRKFVGKTIRRH